MSPTWDDGGDKPVVSVGPFGWIIAILRGGAIAVMLGIGLLATLILRPVEWLLSRKDRLLTPMVSRVFFRLALAVIGIKPTIRGRPMRGAGAVVANHASWLDIIVLNAAKQVYFVAKSDVAGWPVIGGLARWIDTAFIERNRRAAPAQVALFRARLARGHRLLFFPEGTSTDTIRVLPFKTTLFAAFFDPALYHNMRIQPVTVVYHAPRGQDPRFYGWWGDMDLGPHLVAVLAAWPQGRVEIVYHDPVRVCDFADRKTLAAHLQRVVEGPVVAAKGAD